MDRFCFLCQTSIGNRVRISLFNFVSGNGSWSSFKVGKWIRFIASMYYWLLWVEYFELKRSSFIYDHNRITLLCIHLEQWGDPTSLNSLHISLTCAIVPPVKDAWRVARREEVRKWENMRYSLSVGLNINICTFIKTCIVYVYFPRCIIIWDFSTLMMVRSIL